MSGHADTKEALEQIVWLSLSDTEMTMEKEIILVKKTSRTYYLFMSVLPIMFLAYFLIKFFLDFEKNPDEFHFSPLLLIFVLSLAVMMLASAKFYYLYKRGKIIINADGIKVDHGLPRLVHWGRRAFYIPWKTVRSVQVKGTISPYAPTLSISTGETKREVEIMAWCPQDYLKNKRQNISWEIIKDPKKYEKFILEQSLVQSIKPFVKEIGLSSFSKTLRSSRNPNSYIALGIGLLLLGYAAVSIYTVSEKYLDKAPYGLMWAVGMVAFFISLLWLRKVGLPPGDTMIRAGLIGLSTIAASYTGLLEVNRFTDMVGLQPYTFELVEKEPSILWRSDRPVIGELTIDMPAEFWGAYHVGDKRIFQLRKGRLGFYQMSLLEMEKEIFDYARTNLENIREVTIPFSEKTVPVLVKSPDGET